MKKIFLLRHAETEGRILDDFHRNLTPNGVAKCANIAKILEPFVSRLDLIVSSSAIRTKQTVENILSHLNYEIPEIIYDKSLYNASEEYLLSYLKNLDALSNKSVNSVILVNHNPAISALANILGNQSKTFSKQLINGFSPGSLVYLESKVDLWNDLDSDNVVVHNFWK